MIFGRLKLYAIAVAAFFFAVLGVYFKGKGAGRQEVENEHTRRRVDAMKTAKEVRDEIWEDIDIADRASRWLRSDDDR